MESDNPYKFRKEIWEKRRPDCIIRVCGDLVEYKSKKEYVPPKRRGLRKTIQGFSRQSRFRLLKFNATIDYDSAGFAVFITLTYPDEFFGRSSKQRSADRHHFLRKIESHCGKQICGIWRVEWEPRLTGMNVGEMMPHLHLLLFFVPFVHYELIRKWWKGVLHAKGEVVTEIKGAYNKRHYGHYVSKYVAKLAGIVPLSLLHISPISGRHFGFVRKALIPRHRTKTLLDPPESLRQEFRALAQQLDPMRETECDDSFTLLWSRAAVAKRILLESGLTDGQ